MSMKIKSWNDDHFIQAIRGGSVVKVPSADSHGRPSIKLKSITDIYESEDTEKLYSGSRPGNVDIVVPFKSMDKETVRIELEYETDIAGNNEICTSNVDDDDLGSMTLKEIKKRSKTKKRRFQRSFDPIKQEIGPSFHGDISSNKQGCFLPWKKDAEPDESFHSPWSEKLKTMINDVARGDSAPSTSRIPVDTTDQILNYQSSSHNAVEMHGPFDPHIESVECDNLDSPNVVHVAEGSTFGSHVKMSYWREHVDGLPKGVDQGASMMRGSFSLCEKTCVLNEVSDEYLEPSNSLFSASTAENSGASSPEIHKAFPSFLSGCLEEVTITHSDPCLIPMEVFPVTGNLGSEKYPNIQGALSCNRNVPDTNNDSDNKEDASDLNPQVVESKTLTHDHDMVTIDPLKPTEFSIGGNGHTINADREIDKDINPDLGCTTSEFPSACVDIALQGSSDIHYFDTTKGLKELEAHEDFLCVKTKTPPKRLFSTRKGISPTSQEKLCWELNAGGLCDNMDTFKCKEKLFIEKQTESENLLTKSVVKGGDVSKMPKAERKYPLLTTSEFPSACVDITLQGSSDIHYSDTTKGLKDVEALEDFLCVKTQNPPKRLFSTRKAISPTSQEKLCRELDAGGCDNMDTFKCREKLFIEKQTESDNLLMKSVVEKADVSVMPEESINKLDNNNTGTPQSVPRGILKVPPVSCPKPSSGTGCTSVYTCAAKAIEFSQRQMHDIDSLAMKLMKELNSIKGIVEDSLCAEVCEVPSSKYTADQIKSAIENVAEAEETTKKWLSMMTKDCTRFCKIMKSSQKKSLMASGYEMKKRKKISFADEDGGVLCHVKVYEDPEASSSHCL